MTDSAPVVCDGDAYFQDPAGFFARLAGPVAEAWMPHYGRVWVVTGYAEVRAMLADPRLSKDVRRWPGGGRTRPSLATGVDEHMLHRDPPDHTRLRRLAQKAFTPRRAAMRPRAQQIAADLLDELSELAGADVGAGGDGVVDLLPQFARPLPIAVICELLGVPAADRAWLRDTVYAYDDAAQHETVEQELAAYFTGLIAAKRADPGDDLVSALILARDDTDSGTDGDTDGGGLTPAELLAMVYLLVMAGFDTTVNLIASGTLALLTHPGELARVRADPSLIPNAVEELLRFTSPVNHANDRFTTEPVTLGGVVIPAGEWVFAVLSAAGRDPAQYPAPDRLDLGRDTGGHVAFGHGVHHCLGAPLARMEAEVALGALLPRYPGLSLAVPGQDLRWRPVSLMNGLESLPVRLG